MKNRLIYVICAVFSAASLFLLLKADNSKALLIGVFNFLLFGIGGLAFYLLNRKRNIRIVEHKTVTIRQNRTKLRALLAACFVFAVCGWLFLPFNHLFDTARRYTPAIGCTIGIAGILFGCAGVAVSGIGLMKPKIIMQISDEGLIVPKGKKQELIGWSEIQAISRNDNFLFIHLSAPDDAVRRTVDIPVALMEYDANQIEDLIIKKINEHIP